MNRVIGTRRTRGTRMEYQENGRLSHAAPAFRVLRVPISFRAQRVLELQRGVSELGGENQT